MEAENSRLVTGIIVSPDASPVLRNADAATLGNFVALQHERDL